MKRIFTIFLCSLCILTVLNSCKKKEQPNTTPEPIPVEDAALKFFMGQSAYGVYKNTEVIFAFDESAHQMAYNDIKRMCRFQNDEATILVQMAMSAIPTLNATLTLGVTQQGLTSISSTQSVVVKKVDAAAQKVWLWTDSTKMGFIARIVQ